MATDLGPQNSKEGRRWEGMSMNEIIIGGGEEGRGRRGEEASRQAGREKALKLHTHI